MRSTICISLLLLALPALAGAETTERISFEDAALDAMPPAANAWADVTSGSLALEGEKLVATLGLTALPEMHAGAAYGVIFHDGTRDWYMVAVSVPTLTYLYGGWASDEQGPAGSSEGSGSYTTGLGATVRIEMPVAELGNATAVSKPRALTADVKTGALPTGGMVIVYFDEAVGEGELALPRAPALDAPAAEPEETAVPAANAADDAPATAAVPAAGAAALIAATLVALALARRWR